jgi:hypothetical protein
MTELEEARAHLQHCQDVLAIGRANGGGAYMDLSERNVLAALSWVWDAQERAERAAVEWLNKELQRRLLELLHDGEPIVNDSQGRQAVADVCREVLESVTINVAGPADIDRMMSIELNLGVRL